MWQNPPPDTAGQFLGPFGTPRGRENGGGRPLTSSVSGAGEPVGQFDAGSPFLGAAHCCHEHEGPTRPIPWAPAGDHLQVVSVREGRSGWTRSTTVELHVERIAALDLGKASLVACVRLPHASKPGRRMQEVREYPPTTAELLDMAVWFRQWKVSPVVMESTGDYWKGVYYLLEAEGFECWLVNARDVKNTPGRAKTDKLDAVWLAKVPSGPLRWRPVQREISGSAAGCPAKV